MTKGFKYCAIYFRFGQYNEDDTVPSYLIGFDCPFDDSPVLYAKDEKELEQKIQEVYDGKYDFIDRSWWGVDWRGVYPNLICDTQGKIQVDLYKNITSYQQFDPDAEKYSWGRETLTQLWEREKWRWNF